MKIIELEEINSTNEYCKRHGKENIIVIAKKQTAGKGTKGRSFVSDGGGLYLSVMKHYDNFLAENAFKIMVNACVAVCKTVQAFGLTPVIRWANDVLVGDKKICGTLIENTFSGSYISRSIVGIGININNSLPEDLQSIATTMSGELNKPLSVKAVKETLIKNLRKNYTVEDYKSYINWFGREVVIKTFKEEITATAVDIDYDGGLLCVVGGSVKKINSAEVSLKI